MDLHERIQSQLGKLILSGDMAGCQCDKCQLDVIQLTMTHLMPESFQGQSEVRGEFKEAEELTPFDDEAILRHLKAAMFIVAAMPHHD